jgi:hypothetical protein
MNRPSILAALTLFLSAQAHAGIFDFSFSNVNGAVNGTVTGTIVLPSGDGTFAATSVVIDSLPAALNLGAGPINVATNGVNSFTVSGGSIVSENFQGQIDGATDLFIDYTSGFPLVGTGVDSEGCACYASQGVLDAYSTTLKFAAAQVPEPSSVALLGAAGIAGALTARRRRERTTRSRATGATVTA